MCYHCKGMGHLKANCPERKKGNKRPWERAWRAKKRKWHQNPGGGTRQEPTQDQVEAGALQNVIEVTDHRFAEDWPEDWDFTANSLKVVKVD